MKRTAITLTEIHDLVKTVSGKILTEYKNQRKAFIGLLRSNITKQIIENWCLCKYCCLYGDVNRCFDHWCNELLAVCENIYTFNIKGGDKENALIQVYLRERKLDTPTIIGNIIKLKFSKERIINPTNIQNVIHEFVKGLDGLITMLSGKSNTPVEYVAKTFNI